MSEGRLIKCGIVGDGAVGKTCLTVSFSMNMFHTGPLPMVISDYTADLNVDGESYTIQLMDTQAQAEYDRLRPLMYPLADVFLSCFAVDSAVSLDNIRYKWIPEVRSSSRVPILLIGNKSDIRSEPGSTVSKQAAENLVRELKLCGYYECSALTRDGVENVFEQATIAALRHRSSKKRHCGRCSFL